jgi:hypothetical protein
MKDRYMYCTVQLNTGKIAIFMQFYFNFGQKLTQVIKKSDEESKTPTVAQIIILNPA